MRRHSHADLDTACKFNKFPYLSQIDLFELSADIAIFADNKKHIIMSYKIIDIEGIGPAYAEKLAAAGIDTAEVLLEKCASPKGRKELAEATGISDKLILTWTNHADLFRVHGVGPQFAELLEAAGVDTVKELGHRSAANLAAKMAEVNAEKHLVGRVPVEKEIQKMIDESKELPGVMTY